MTKTSVEEDTNQVVTYIRDGDKIGIMMFLRQGGDPNTRNHMGWTLLHLACLEGQAEISEILLDAGAMVNCCTTEMCTPLHLASARGNKKAVEVLVAKGAYVNAQDKAGNTPLHEAAKSFHTKVVKFLLEKKADSKRINKKNQTFIDLVGQQLMPTVESGDVEILVEWLDWGINANTVGNLHWSLLHHASAMGQINIASLLLEREANVNILDSNRSTPLHSACSHGHKRIVDLLIGRGADINAKDQRGNTPLHSAIAGEHPEVINLLLENGSDPSIPNKDGQIFTHLVNEFLIDAVEKSRVAHVISLLKGRANPDTRDVFGYPVLCSSVFKGDLLIVDALLEAGANPNICSEDTMKTPLHYAAGQGNLFVMKLLLDKGASVSNKDKHGYTPLHEAAKQGDKDTVTVLVGRSSSLNAQDAEGNTPLHVAARWGQSDIVEMLLEKGTGEDIKNKNGMLYSDLALMRAVRTEDASQVVSGLAWGGNPDIQDSKGWTLLHHAVYKSSSDVCFVLLEAEADVNIPDKHGRTPLLLAAYRGEYKIVEMLIDAGADINAKDSENQTPLHWAADEGSIETVELLISKGANRNCRNKKGFLYSDLLLKHLYFAVRHKDESKVESLLRAGADQSAELVGTEITPREEAKRRKHYSILKKMISLAPSKPRPKSNKEEIIALEDVRKLFEDREEDDTCNESSDESDKENYDPDEEAYWRMHNAPIVLNAKDLIKDEEKSFWDHWEEKPKVIAAKEFFKDDTAWWETVSSSDEELYSEDNSSKAVSTFEELKKKWKDVVPAKEFFREDECWWRDAVEDLDKKISAKEFFKEKTGWWEESSSEEEGKDNLDSKGKGLRYKNNISAKEFFKEDDVPWWTENSSEEEKEEEYMEEEEESENAHKYLHIDDKLKGEEKSEEESLYEDIEESITEDWDTANDSIMSDTSTMYSASEGNKIMAADLFVEKPWWYDDDDQTDNSLSDEDELSEDKSDRTETTEIADDGSFIDRERINGRARILSLTESDASTNIILDAADSNSIENLLDLDIDEETESSIQIKDISIVDNLLHTSEYPEINSVEMKEDMEKNLCSVEKYVSTVTNSENNIIQQINQVIDEESVLSCDSNSISREADEAVTEKCPKLISKKTEEKEESIMLLADICDNNIDSLPKFDNISQATCEKAETDNKKYSSHMLHNLKEEQGQVKVPEIDIKESKLYHLTDNNYEIKEISVENRDKFSLISTSIDKITNESNSTEPIQHHKDSNNIIGNENVHMTEVILSKDSLLNENRSILEDKLIRNAKTCQVPSQKEFLTSAEINNEISFKNDLNINMDRISSHENNILNINDQLNITQCTVTENNTPGLNNGTSTEKIQPSISTNVENVIGFENMNKKDKDSNKDILNFITETSYSSIKSNVEDKFKNVTLDKACHLDLAKEPTDSITHSQTDAKISNIKFNLISGSNPVIQSNAILDMKENLNKKPSEEVVELKKTVINKMDACLARVDASLAWVNARMANDTLNKSNAAKSKSLECITEPQSINKHKKAKLASHENIYIPDSNNVKDIKNNDENFQIFRIKVRITDPQANNTLERYIERPHSTPESVLKGSSSENALDSSMVDNSSNFMASGARTKILKYNSLPKLETNNSHLEYDSKFSFNTSVCDKSKTSNKKDYLLNSHSEISNKNENKIHRIQDPLVLRQHSLNDVDAIVSSAKKNLQCNNIRKYNFSDKNIMKNDLIERKNILPLKIRRHSAHEIQLNENSLHSYSEQMNNNFSHNQSNEKKLSADEASDNKKITCCNKILENLNNCKDILNSIEKLANTENQMSKPVLNTTATNKLDFELNLRTNDNIDIFERVNTNNDTDLQGTPIDNLSYNISQGVSSSVIKDSNISPTLDKSNWTWSTFQSKSLNEYDNILNVKSLEYRSHPSFKKHKSIGSIEELNDTQSTKDLPVKLKHQKFDDKNLCKDSGNKSLNTHFATNKCVATSNLRVKPPLPPRRTKDNRQTAILNDTFDDTKNTLKKIDLNDTCLSYDSGENEKGVLEDQAPSCTNSKETWNTVDVKPHGVLDNIISDQMPKPPPRKKMKEEVKRSSSCSIC